jgi:hypothetical protein
MRNSFNFISNSNDQNRKYNFEMDIVNRFSETQFQKSIYAPELNARIVEEMMKRKDPTINSSSLLHGRSFIKF